MNEGGGWKAFREASKQLVNAATAAEELERAAVVAHRVSIELPTADAAVAELDEAGQELTPVSESSAADSASAPEEKSAARIVADARSWFMRNATSLSGVEGAERSVRERLVSWVRALPKRLAHWSVLAIVPVAAAASLLAVRAGVNPYALCMQWWDMAYGAVFLTACLIFLSLAIWKGPRGAWHPGAPALAVAVVTAPLWLATNLIFGSGCREMPATPILVPPLPPPIEVPPVWTVPVPQPRPFDLFPEPQPPTTPANAPPSPQTIRL